MIWSGKFKFPSDSRLQTIFGSRASVGHFLLSETTFDHLAPTSPQGTPLGFADQLEEFWDVEGKESKEGLEGRG